jgi:hypothetical protein
MARSLFVVAVSSVLLIGGTLCGCADPSVAEGGPAVTGDAGAREEAPGARPVGDLDGAILRAARTPIVFRATTAADVEPSDPREAPSTLRLVAGSEGEGEGAPMAAPAMAAPAPDPAASAENSARKSISQMGLILTRKIVLPAYPTRRTVSDAPKTPGPDKPSGGDRKPAPSPGRMLP